MFRELRSLFCAFLLAAPRAVVAQVISGDSAGISRELLAHVASLRDQAAIRIATPTTVIIGRFAMRGGDSIRVRVNRDTQSVNLRDVDGLWFERRHSEHTAAGVVIGGAAGLFAAAIPAAFASLACADGGPSGCKNDASAILTAGAVIGGVIGGVVGQAMGSTPQWRQVFPLPGMAPPATQRLELARDSVATPPPPRAIDSRLLIELARFKPGAPIRYAAGGNVHAGNYATMTTDSLEIQGAGTAGHVHLRDVDEIWSRVPTSRTVAKYTGIGALGGPLFYYRTQTCPTDPTCKNLGSRIALSVAVGAAAGAVVGKIIDERSPQWSRRYARWLQR